MKIIKYLAIIVILIAGYLFLNKDSALDVRSLIQGDSEIKIACEKGGGNYLPEFKECEFISDEQCTDLGGTFNECESACRHDKDAMVCTQQCVPVCTFE